MTEGKSTRHLTWCVPFLCIALIALGLLRPKPTAQPPLRGHAVIDAEGVEAYIQEPFRGIALTWGAWSADGYLMNTKSPDTIMNAGGPVARHRFDMYEWTSKIYPQVLRDDKYWNVRYGDEIQRAKGDLEALYAFNPGVFLGNGGDFGMVPFLRRTGLPVLSLCWYRPEDNWDDCSYSAARIETSLIGHPEDGEALIARYKQAFADIKEELKPETIGKQPRMLLMMSSKNDWSFFYLTTVGSSFQIYLPRAAVENASIGNTGERIDAERLLAMDPDIIILYGSHNAPDSIESPQEFLRDPRWRGLKAVRERRVYRMAGGGGLSGLVLQPIDVRWLAEVAHPDRLQPRVRQIMRDRFLTEFNYQLSEEQIDKYLNVEENRGMRGAERFERDAPPPLELEASK